MSPGKSLQQTLQPNKYTVYTTSIGYVQEMNCFVLSQHHTHMYGTRSPATAARRCGTWPYQSGGYIRHVTLHQIKKNYQIDSYRSGGYIWRQITIHFGCGCNTHGEM